MLNEIEKKIKSLKVKRILLDVLAVSIAILYLMYFRANRQVEWWLTLIVLASLVCAYIVSQERIPRQLRELNKQLHGGE